MTHVALRERPTDRLLELGGGANPLVLPACLGGRDINADVREAKLPDGRAVVDVVCDLNERLPFADGEFDGVVSRYCIEHLSWRRVRQFVAETFRVCRPGGRTVVITADVEAQLRWIHDHPDGWDGKDFFDSASCVLFGDQDYPENSHKNYMSHKVAAELFRAVGFDCVAVQSFGDRQTDLLLTAKRPNSDTSPVQETPMPAINKPPLMVSDATSREWQGPFVVDGDQPRNRRPINAIEAGCSGQRSAPAVVAPPAEQLTVHSAEVKVAGRRLAMYHPMLDDASRLMATGDYERFESNLARTLVRPGDTVIDVGAHVGHYTLLFADAVGPTGSVLAFEPFPPNRERLGVNVRAAGFDDRVTVMPYALFDNDGPSDLFANPRNSGDNRLWLQENWLRVPVECRRLDGLLDAASKVDVIKIDVQGAEVHALRGMRELLRAQKRLTVFVELWPIGVRFMDATLEEFAELFADWRLAFQVTEDPPALTPISSLDGLIKPQSSHFANLIMIK